MTRKFVAILLSTAMMALSMPIAVFADGGVVVEAIDENKAETAGDVEADRGPAAEVTANNGHTASLEAGNLESHDPGVHEENEENDDNDVYVAALDVSADNGAEAKASAENVKGADVGVYTDAESGGNAFAVVGSAEGGNYGASAYAVDENSVSAVIVEENAEGINDNSIGVDVESENKGVAGVSVGGDACGGFIGAYADSKSGGKSIIEIEGDAVSTSGVIDGAAVWEEAEGEGSVSIVSIGGSATGVRGGAYMVARDGGYSELDVEGDVKATGQDSIGLEMWADGGVNDALVKGNVNGEFAGLGLYGTDGSENLVVVEGTISGDEIGVILFDDPENTAPGTLSVWKIEKNKDGSVAGVWNDAEQKVVEDRDFEKTINYIIKIEQPAKGASLTAVAEDGSALATVDGFSNQWQTAHEGDKVLLKINLEDGYKVTGAFGDEGKTLKLLKDDKGNYYVEVPKGGGVYLSVTLSKLEQEVQKDKKDKKDDSDSNKENKAPAFIGMTDTEMIFAIATAPVNGTVYLRSASGTSLSAAVVMALMLRPDVTVNLTFVLNGVTYMVIIPAWTDLKPLLNSFGGIDLITLVTEFKAVPIG